jgi:hypothetical protein
VRPDKLTERLSIPALRPGQEVGSHAAIVPQTFREQAAPSGPPEVSARMKDINAGITPARTEGPDNASVHLQLPLREGLRRYR